MKAINRVSLAVALNLLAQICMSLQGCSSGAQISPVPAARSESSPTVSGATIWRGESHGIEIHWTTVDLFAKSDAKIERIWAPLVQKGFADFVAALTGGPPATKDRVLHCSYERRFKILSVVGTLVSFEDQYSDDCGGAHPSADTRFTTVDLSKPGNVQYARQEDTPMMNIDLAKPGKVTKLTDYFAEQDVLQALLADHVIQKALAGLNRQTAPRTLAELPELFAANDYALGDLDFELRSDFLTRFVFHHIEGDKIAVRLGLPPHSGANRSAHQQLGLLLTIPASLKQDLGLATSRQQGFLMIDAEQISNRQATAFRLSTDK